MVEGGGIGSGDITASAEIYDPGSDSWSGIGDMHQFVLDTRQRCYAMGACSWRVENAELYGPRT